MTTTTFERLNSSPMIPNFIKKRFKRKIEMSYWSDLCGIKQRRKSFIKNLKNYRIHKLTTQLNNLEGRMEFLLEMEEKTKELEEKVNERMELLLKMEERMKELEKKMEKFDEIFQKEKSEKE
jgi:hypothetical protein